MPAIFYFYFFTIEMDCTCAAVEGTVSKVKVGDGVVLQRISPLL